MVYIIVYVWRCAAHGVIEGAVAQVNTHLHTDPEEPRDEVIALQNALLLELQEGEEEERRGTGQRY